MAVEQKNIQINVDIDAQQGARDYQKLLDRTKQLNNEMRKLKRAGKENTEEFKALKKEADQLNKEFEKFDLSTARMGQLEKRASELTRAIRYKLTPGTKEFIRTSDELKKVKRRLEEIKEEAGLTRQAFQEVRIAGIKIPDGLVKGINGVNNAFKAFLALQIIQYFIDLFRIVDETTKQFVKLRGSIQNFTGATGDELDNYTVRLAAISATFQKDQEEVLEAANALTKQLTGDFTESLDLIEKGFLAGADANGEFLDTLKEYPTFFREAKLSGEQMISVITQSVREGVFSDKGVDLIKEFNIRVREMPKATKEALNAIGLSSRQVSDEIDQNGIGGAFRLVQERLNSIEDDAPATGQALADIFGGPGEDAGIQFIKNLQLTDDTLDDLIDTSNEYTVLIMEQLTANEELAEAQNRVSKGFSDASGSLQVYITKAKTLLYNVADSILEFFEQLPATVKGVQAAFRQVFDNIENFFQRTWINLQVTYKQITKLNPFGKTSEQINQEIAVLRSKRDELAEEGGNVMKAYREAMLAELDNVERRKEVSAALAPTLQDSDIRSAAQSNAKRVVDAYDEELAKARADRANQPGPVSTIATLPTPSSVESTGEQTQDVNAQQERLKNRFLQALITEQQYEDQRFQLQQAAYDRRLAFLREKHGEESLAFVSLQNEKLEEQRRYEADQLELSRRTEQAKAQIQEQGVQALNSFVDATISLLGKDERNRKKYAGTLKAFEVGKITIAGISEVQKIWEGAAQFGPLQSVFAVGQTLAAVLRTKSAIDEVRGTGFYTGGYTGNKGLFNDNKGRKVVGAVHENEWVAPAWMNNHPQSAPIIQMLETMRKRGYNEGGFANANPVPGVSAGTGADTAFLQKTLDQIAEGQMMMAEAIERKQFQVMTGQIRDALDEDYRLDSKSGF